MPNSYQPQKREHDHTLLSLDVSKPPEDRSQFTEGFGKQKSSARTLFCPSCKLFFETFLSVIQMPKMTYVYPCSWLLLLHFFPFQK